MNTCPHPVGASQIIGALRSALSTFKKDPRNKNRPIARHPAESTNPDNPDSDNVRPTILDAPRSPPGASQIIGALRSALSTFKKDPRNKNRPIARHPAESTNPDNPDSDNVRPAILDAGASRIGYIQRTGCVIMTPEQRRFAAGSRSIATKARQSCLLRPSPPCLLHLANASIIGSSTNLCPLLSRTKIKNEHSANCIVTTLTKSTVLRRIPDTAALQSGRRIRTYVRWGGGGGGKADKADIFASFLEKFQPHSPFSRQKAEKWIASNIN